MSLVVGNTVSFTTFSNKNPRKIKGKIVEFLHYFDEKNRILRISELDSEGKAHTTLVPEWYTAWIPDFKVQ